VSIVVPCYNEAAGLEETLGALATSFVDTPHETYEFVLVDDHSTDATPAILASACEREARVKMLRLGANVGSHIAYGAGLRACTGDVAALLTADLQEGPELIGPALEAWRRGADVVCAVAEGRDRGGIAAGFFARTFYVLLWGAPGLRHVEDPRSVPLLMDRAVVDRYAAYAPRHHNLFVWILQQRFHAATFRYTPRPRSRGASTWTLKKRLVLAADTLFDVRSTLLTMWLPIGAALAAAGCVAAVVAIVALARESPPCVLAATLTCAVVAFVGGLILISIGAVGAYVWRIYEGLRHGPEYTIESSRNIARDPKATEGVARESLGATTRTRAPSSR
jgi:dolichol-phosphate mannosyltransferase